jgi:hypothetical protein
MNSKKELLTIFRRLQTIFSIFLFSFIAIYFTTTTEFNIKDIQMSKWGTIENFGWIFNLGLMLISISLCFNSFIYIKKHNRILYKKFFYILFLIVSSSLFFTGFFDVEDYRSIHNVFAYTYFFSYPLSIFILSHLNRRSILYKDWLSHITFSVLMILLPLSLMSFFNGMAIPEISHTIIVMIWNLKILIKN